MISDVHVISKEQQGEQSQGVGYSLKQVIWVFAAPSGRDFALCGSENGYTLGSFWSGIGSGFRINCESV